MVINQQVEIAGYNVPFEDITAPVPARDSARITDAKVHLETSAMQVLCHLAARLAAADHQHRAVWELPRVAVVPSMKLCNLGGQLAIPTRDIRMLVRPDSNDQIVGGEITLRCHEFEPPRIV